MLYFFKKLKDLDTNFTTNILKCEADICYHLYFALRYMSMACHHSSYLPIDPKEMFPGKLSTIVKPECTEGVQV